MTTTSAARPINARKRRPGVRLSASFDITQPPLLVNSADTI